jgi:2-(1,2-epoxy-1,2-dihydrophenyl)acetyl-CoA isomerase
MATSAEEVLLDEEAGVAVVTLNRPHKLNAMSTELLDKLLGLLETLHDNEGVHVIVLTGAGRGFCAGGDLSGGIGTIHGGGAIEQSGRVRWYARISQLLHSMPQVTIAAVNGPCAGAAISLVLACDLRLASSAAVFNPAFLDVGVSGDLGGPWFATRVLGAARSRELYLATRRFSAADALRQGLVSQVVDGSEFAAHWRQVAADLASRPPMALRFLKANFVDAEVLPLSDYLDIESRRVSYCAVSADAAAAVATRFGR